MAHVFISYNQADADFAENLCTHLEQAGIETWMDRDNLKPGQNWSEDIDRGIRTSFAVVVVMSPEARASEYVTYEWSAAIGAGIPVIPAVVKDTSLHPRLGRVQHLDFTNIKVRPWDDLIAYLRENYPRDQFEIKVPADFPIYLKNAVNRLDDPMQSIVEVGVTVLRNSDDPRAIHILRQAINHPYIVTRSLAAAALIEDGEIADYILKEISNFNPSILFMNADAYALLRILPQVIGYAERDHWTSKEYLPFDAAIGKRLKTYGSPLEREESDAKQFALYAEEHKTSLEILRRVCGFKFTGE